MILVTKKACSLLHVIYGLYTLCLIRNMRGIQALQHDGNAEQKPVPLKC